MKKRLMALLMALVLVLGTTSTVFASSSVGDNTQDVKEIEVSWNHNENGVSDWSVRAERNNELEYTYIQYVATLYTDADEYVASQSVYYFNEPGAQGGEYVWFNFADQIGARGDGKYYVTVQASIWSNETYKYEVFESGMTDVAEYKAPAEKLGTVNATVTDGVLTFDLVEGAAFYSVEVKDMTYSSRGEYEYVWLNEYIYPEEWYMENVDDIKFVNDGKSIEFDFAKFYVDYVEMNKANAEEYGYTYTETEHNFTFFVQAKARDINKVQSSDVTKAGTYEIRFSSEQIKENVDKLFTDEALKDPAGLSQAYSYIAYTLSKDTVANMMADPAFAAKVQAVEGAYAEQLGLPAATTVSTSTAVDASKVSVVGALLNAWGEGQQVSLSVADAKEATAPTGYSNAVALDLQLLVGETSISTLTVPVQITMPIPTGVSTEKLVILHYHGDATEPTIITPVVNADGTMTFTVTGFSTFIVANQGVVPAPGTTDTTTDATTTVKPQSPGTGETGTTVVCAMLLAVAGAAILMKRKSIVK